jgi:hypothetical protein
MIDSIWTHDPSVFNEHETSYTRAIIGGDEEKIVTLFSHTPVKQSAPTIIVSDARKQRHEDEFFS